MAGARAGAPAIDWYAAYARDPDKPRLPYDLTGREYLVACINDTHPNIVTMKGSQGGFTVQKFLKCVRLLDIKQGRPAIYTLPRDEDVKKFRKIRLGKIMRGCPRISALNDAVESDGKDSSCAIKVGDTWILLQPTISKRSGVSDPASILIVDEYDRSDMVNVSRYASRLGAEVEPIRETFSNPTLPDEGIDSKYQLTDKRVWVVKCPHCGYWQSQEWEPDDRWSESSQPFIVVPRAGNPVTVPVSGPHTSGRTRHHDHPYYACRQCRREMKWYAGMPAEWRAEFELPRIIDGISYDIRGYHWSQLNAWSWMSAKRIVDDFQNYRDEGNEADAYGMILGKPHKAGTVKLNAGEVRACEVRDIKWQVGSGETDLILAADQGPNGNHYMVMKKVYTETGAKIRVMHAEIDMGMMFDSVKDGIIVPGRISLLREMFGPTIIVIDSQPNVEQSYSACLALDGLMWRVLYIHSQKIPVLYQQPDPLSEKLDYVVKVNKTAAMSLVVRKVQQCEWEFPPLDDAPGGAGLEIIKHLVKIKKVTDQKTQEVTWQGKPDHFANVLLYGLVGAMGIENNVPRNTVAPVILSM